jgi:hypothetical protein
MRLQINLPMEYTTNKIPHQIIAMGEHEGVTFYVVNINGRHPCAYIRIPKGMPLYGLDYDDLDQYEIEVHYGWTYARDFLVGVVNDDESWFIGWDYGHCCDFEGYYLNEKDSSLLKKNKRWTTDEIIEECKEVCEEISKLWEPLR